MTAYKKHQPENGALTISQAIMLKFLAPLSGSRSKGRADDVGDNYEEFIKRLDKATGNLKERHAALSRVQSVVAATCQHNEAGFEQWSQRRIGAKGLLTHQAGHVTNGDALMELHNVAVKMESTFRTRTAQVRERAKEIQHKLDGINKSLLELEGSRGKLTSSRILVQEKEKLSRALADLAGTAEGVATAIADPGLRQDLAKAREAVILAEALMEVKGT